MTLAASSSTSSRKRTYQPSIAAFFPKDEGITSLAIREVSNTSENPTALRPLPPAHIQSSLLNVGMRIRKAVPGGYQTQKAFELEQGPSGVSTTNLPRRTATQSASLSNRPREVQPYCSASADIGNAMHDIGGWGIQPRSDTYIAPKSSVFGSDHDKENDMPSNQESNSSIDSMPHNKAKRGWHDEAEIDIALQPTYEPDAPQAVIQQRFWARPRARAARRRQPVFSVAPTPTVNVLDFDEAEFLCGR